LDFNYSMLLGWPWLHNSRVIHDLGNNLFTIEGNDMVQTITFTKYLDNNTKCFEVLLCYDWIEGVTNKEENIFLIIKLALFTLGTITLPKLDIFSVAIFGAKVDTKDFMFNFPHFEGEISVDTTLACIQIQELETKQWMLLENHQVWLLNLGTTQNPQIIKLNATLVELVATDTKTLFREYKDIFAWNYIDLKGIPPQIVQHCIKVNTIIPPTH
jgi:hypothetical protein